MQPIPSTAEILMFKILNHSVDEAWVSWAVDMLVAGFDTEHLIELAGISSFDNQFELSALTDKVFAELKLDLADTDKIFRRYASYIIWMHFDSGKDTLATLSKLVDLLYFNNDELYNFSLLYWAKQDLTIDGNQYYWPNANSGNIDSIVINYFNKWLADNPLVF